MINLFEIPINIIKFFKVENFSHKFRKLENLKRILKVHSLLEIKPFDKNLKNIVAKVGDNYILSSMEYDTKLKKFNFKQLGRMKGYPYLVRDCEEYYPDKDIYYSFYIAKVKANEFRKGIGKKLIQLAKCESYRYDCNGKIHLDAVNEARPPFYFYRALGFDSQDKLKINIIDQYRKLNQPLPDKYKKWCISMYLPENKTGMRI